MSRPDEVLLEPIERAASSGLALEHTAEGTFVLLRAIWCTERSEDVLEKITSQSRKVSEERGASKCLVLSPRYLYIAKNTKKSEYEPE